MRSGTHISFYLRLGTIHIHHTTIRNLGNPAFIRFLISDDGNTMLVQSFDKKTFQSFRVPGYPSDQLGKVQIHSKGFCDMMVRRFGWDPEMSYRIPGKPYPTQSVAAFDLSKADAIHGWWKEARSKDEQAGSTHI